MVQRAKALTDRTTTHRYRSAVSDPSELGSEPDSWLKYSALRARMKIHVVGTCVRARLGQPRNSQAVTSCQ